MDTHDDMIYSPASLSLSPQQKFVASIRRYCAISNAFHFVGLSAILGREMSHMGESHRPLIFRQIRGGWEQGRHS